MNISSKANPHDALEHFRAVRHSDKHGEVLDLGPDMLDEIEDWMGKSILFDFSGFTPSNEHIAFGFSMIEHGIFRLPYEMVAIKLGVHGASGARLVFMEHADEGIGVMTTTASASPDLRQYGFLPNAVHYRPTFKWENKERFVMWKTRPILTKNMMANVFPDTKTADDVFHIHIREAIGCIAALMSKETTTEHRPAQEKLNKKRLKAGRPQINPSYKVRVNLSAATGGSGASHGDRKSPRPHWRRGHIRRIYTKQGTKLTPVAPTLVAANTDLIKPSDYIVRG